MKRFEADIRKKEREKFDELANQINFSIVETNPPTLSKLLAGEAYTKEDILECAKKIFSKFNWNINETFLVIDNPQNLGNKRFLAENKPFFVIYEKSEKRWVLMTLIFNQMNEEMEVLFKDPSGAAVPNDIKANIEVMCSKVSFVIHPQVEIEEDDDKLYGPLSLRNLTILLNCVQKNPANLKDAFLTLEFSNPDKINEDRLNEVIRLTHELSENQKFKDKLKEFTDNLPLELSSGMMDYKKVLEEELEKDEEEMDIKKINAAREKFLNQQNIEKFQQNYQINKTNMEDEETEYELDIQKEFPQEMKKLGNIFQVLEDIKVEKQLYAALENISECLDIEYKNIKTLYESKFIQENEKVDEKLDLVDINSIAAKLPVIKEFPLLSENTPLPQLLEEIVLGMDQPDISKISQSSEEITELERKYHIVKTKYEIWKNCDIHDINNWAQKVKTQLGADDEDICEAIAIMDRAYDLLTGGYRLRDTQILAVLIFFHSHNAQGRLCEIKTGEGKTVIISFIATIKILQGETVDIITSNPVLADASVEETRNFYAAFNITVSTNNTGSNTTNDFKIGYTADVLYGTISNFQFDYLKDTFEGFNIRRERKFGQVILDEVDSMLIDNGGHIAKLASPYPGMECLRYIYIKIWQELHKAEESFVKESQAKIEELLNKYSDLDSDKSKIKEEYENLVQELTKSERKIIKDKIRASNPTDIPLIPAHLKEYVSSKLEIWIKNALHAKYNCHEHQQYRIMTNDEGERVITPVDYLNTGVTLKNTIWSNGLHQFIQLKHNLQLTFESLTSSFISNIGYIKNYQDKNFFGLTGTLGSRAEQELLSDIYNVNYAKLPTYMKKKFEELPGLIVNDQSWHVELTAEVVEKVDEGRAVLVICETEKDLLAIEDNLNILQKFNNFRIRIFANEDDADETSDKVKIGDIILATNIAGRGTNFKTEDKLELNGGLHVCVGFLPCNLRVEEQAFGRTSRQGNNGTAQLIIRQSEVDELGIIEVNADFSLIKKARDCLERERLQKIRKKLVCELNFKDELFSYFANFYRTLKQEKNTREYMFVLQDLKEFWAYWLEKKNYKAKNLEGKTPKGEYNSFISDADEIINGNIKHNPFYCISLADHYLQNNARTEAAATLRHAINMYPNENSELLAGAHIKLFELAILDGHQALERFKKAIGDIFGLKTVKKNEQYKREAVTHLKNAEKAIEKEIKYIETYLTTNEEKTKTDFKNILTEEFENNPLLKHIYSKLYSLKVHHGNITNLIKTIETVEGGVDINGKVPTTLENLDKIDRKCKLSNYITDSELTELQSIGIDVIYSLREIHDVSNIIIEGSRGQILAGIAALIVGLCFSPVFFIMSGIAGTLISEGIIDIVMELLSRGDSEFSEKDYIKGKFISYGISLLCMGISAIAQSVTILTKAVAFCRKLSSFLRRSTYLKSLCNKLANLVDKLGDVLEKSLLTVKFNKLSKEIQLKELTELQTTNLDKFEHLGGLEKLKQLQNLQKVGKLKELKRAELLVGFVKKVSLDTGKEILQSIVNDKILKPLLEKVVFKNVTECVRNQIKESLNNNAKLMEKLQTSPVEKIDEAMENFLGNNENEIKSTAENIGMQLLGKLNNTVTNVIILGYDTTKIIQECVRYANNCASYFESALEGGSENNNVDLIIEDISTKLSDQILSLLIDLFSKFKNSLIKPLVVNASSLIFGKMMKEQETEESIDTASSSIYKSNVFAGDADDEENSYLILGLSEDASFTEVRKMYLKLCLQLRPDKNLNDPTAKEKFQRLQEAYEKISKLNEEGNKTQTGSNTA